METALLLSFSRDTHIPGGEPVATTIHLITRDEENNDFQANKQGRFSKCKQCQLSTPFQHLNVFVRTLSKRIMSQSSVGNTPTSFDSSSANGLASLCNKEWIFGSLAKELRSTSSCCQRTPWYTDNMKIIEGEMERIAAQLTLDSYSKQPTCGIYHILRRCHSSDSNRASDPSCFLICKVNISLVVNLA